VSTLTWEWLSGFFQAEGSVSGFVNQSGKARAILNLGQSKLNSSILDDIQTLVRHDYSYTPTVHESVGPYNHTFCRLKVNKTNVAVLMAYKMLPYLRSVKRSQVFDWFEKYELPAFECPQLPLSWEFVTGFWEGDGSTVCWTSADGYESSHFSIDFTQNSDLELLQNLRDFFGKGSYSSLSHLRVNDSIKEGLPLHRKLLEHVRMDYRKSQLEDRLKCFNEQQVRKR